MAQTREILHIADEIAKLLEGLSLAPYHDLVGFLIVGYGHLPSRERGADPAKYPSLADEQEAIALL